MVFPAKAGFPFPSACSMQPLVKLSFDFDIEDWKRYVRFLLQASPVYRRLRLRGQILRGAAFSLVGTALVLNSDSLDDAKGAIGLLCWLLAVVTALIHPWLYNYRMAASSARQMDTEENRNLLGPREMELMTDGVHLVSRIGESFFKAEAIYKVVATPELLLLFISSMQAIIVPKVKIAPEEFEQAAAFAKEHYGRGGN